MAEKTTIARPYAKAIFEIATNDKIYGQWSRLLSLLAMIVMNSLRRSNLIFYRF